MKLYFNGVQMKAQGNREAQDQDNFQRKMVIIKLEFDQIKRWISTDHKILNGQK